MTSLRARLFLILVLATGAIWLSAVGWIYLGSQAKLESVLDTRLQEAATMVHSLVAQGNLTTAAATLDTPTAQPVSYARQLSCQIWSLSGDLLAHSSGAPGQKLSDSASGFSERLVDGELWRVFAIDDPEKGLRVLVGDRLGLRDRLVTDLIAGLLAPLLLVLPLLGLLIWACLGQGLRPLMAMAAQIKARGPDDMSTIDDARAPAEVRPLSEALNGLLAKVEAARRHERDVTAFAAHELRTPLAGLKTQAQIALATPDAPVRDGALRQIIVSVDRTARLVRQLLILARLDAGATGAVGQSVNIGRLLDEIVAGQSDAGAHRISVDPHLHRVEVTAEAEALGLALRNLLENALQHTPPGGAVTLRLDDGPPRTLVIEDDGPGIPPEELPLVTQRFYRGQGSRAAGTGLGLAIADVALARAGSRLMLENRTDHPGLRATLALPR